MRYLEAVGDQVNTKEKVRARRSFIDSMKGFSRRLIKRKTSSLTRVRDYADDVLPPLAEGRNQQRSSPPVPSIATTVAAATRPAAGNADRLRWVNPKDRREMECTRSNLG